MLTSCSRWLLLPAAFALVAGCTAPEAQDEPVADTPLWQFETATDELVAASCPDSQPFTRADAFDVSVTPLDLSGIDAEHGLTGWVLDSENGEFGGLSGMAVMASGTLLTVSDKGAFIWLTMENGAPTGAAHYAKMLGADGERLGGKTQGDAEGLALRNGIALVSFERDHRVLAFDLEGCGAAPLGVPVAQIAERPQGLSRTMRENGGLEGLSLLPDGTLAAVIETRDPGVPYGRLREGGRLVVDGQVPTFQAQAGTGIDVVGDTLYALHRDYRPGDGNYITVSETPLVDGVPDGERTRALLTLDPSVPVDNFEAISAVTGEDGRATRLYILSDDNFNDAQRTLLFAIDLNSP